ncbi:type II secretion system protein [Verminephrobacter eiseniae]|uniref:type II secretion system protein n=2 Tax=Verminephrobacter eiseniae TaxID=364317 RepID=UPI0038B23F87
MRMARCRRVGQTRCGGFSYLWLLLLLAFIGVGLAVAAQLHATAVQRQCEQELLAIGWQFRTALGRYHEAQQVAGKKEYPPSLEDLLQDPRFPGIERHLRKIFVDPITRKKQWGTLKIGGRIVGVHSLSEAATLKRDGFEPEDMAFKGKQKYSDWVFTYPPNLIVPVESEAAPGASGAAPGASSGK